MSITMTKLMFATPMTYFAIKLIVKYTIGHFQTDPEKIQRSFMDMIYFSMTACATTFYKGKGDFTPFTLNTRGVISLIMLITPFILDFISMWIDREDM